MLVGLVAPLALAILVPFRSRIPNADAALAMILVVVAVAARNGYRLAGILAALSVAVWFDFFLTQPYETLSHHPADRRGPTVLLLVIGIWVTEIAVWGRRQHLAASRRGYLDGISSAAQAVAAGGSAPALTEQVTAAGPGFSLRSCSFQYGVAGVGRPARLRHDGSVTIGERAWDVDAEGFPASCDTELLVESGGMFQAALMAPALDARPTLEQRLLAVALANQVGAALATSHPVDQS